MWALEGDLVPIYPLYALLFADSGLSDVEISALFALCAMSLASGTYNPFIYFRF